MNDIPSDDTSPKRSSSFINWGRITGILLTLVSICVIAIAFFAYKLGLDSDQEWGISRKILLYCGVGGLLISQHKYGLKILTFAANELRRFLRSGYTWLVNLASVRMVAQVGSLGLRRISSGAKASKFYQWVSENLRKQIRHLTTWLRTEIPGRWFLGSRSRQTRSLVALLAIPVILIYAWLTSVGNWSPWPATTDYYDRLAKAFLRGQTSLIETPKQELLQLEDPYDIEQREGIPYPWDVSLYNGKYYLYWGPTPAIILLPVKLLTNATVGDQVLTFFFVSGAFLFGLGVLLIARKEFTSLPVWTIVPIVLGLGFINPMPWLLSRPAIYEAAISSGQFFYLAGLYLLLFNLHKGKITLRSIVVLSSSWALAIGSRATLLPAIAVSAFGGFLMMSNGRVDQPIRHRRYLLLAMFVPLLVGICLSGWYNFSRFGSVLDFGHRYQLTGMNLNLIYNQILSLSNVIPNAYNYFINPMRTLDIFPYVKAHWGINFMPPLLGPTNNLYYSEQVTGVLRSSPFLLFALVPVLFFWQSVHAALKQRKNFRDLGRGLFSDHSLVDALLLTSGAILLFVPILFFIVCTMRYLADVIPTLMILSSLGFWMGYERLQEHPVLRKAFSSLGIGLAIYSVLVGMFLSITGYNARFEHINLDLFEKLTRMFTF